MSEGSQDRGGIRFESAAQQACYQRIIPLIQAFYGDSVILSDDEPTCFIQQGSAFAVLGVRALPGGEPLITISSLVVSDAELAPDLLEKLLRANYDLVGSAFCISAKGEIMLVRSLRGDCSEKQLMLSVSEVANTADLYDDIIIEQWGGVRSSE